MSELPSLIIDAKARAAALSTEQSFCVSAPAGSGKTELLTQRYLKLLAIVEHPEQVLAMTFTRKAAAEMRERIIQALALGRCSEEPKESHRILTWQLAQKALQQDTAQGWKILNNPLRLRVQTIDSLSQAVARDQPVLSQIGGTLQTVDDASPLYEKAIKNFLQELGRESAIGNDIAELLMYFDNNLARISQLFMQMLPFRDQWLNIVTGFVSDDDIQKTLDLSLKKWIEQTLAKAGKSLAIVASDIALCADFSASVLDASAATKDNNICVLKGIDVLPGSDISEHKKWLAIVELLLTKQFQPRKNLSKAQGFPPKSDKEFGVRSEQYKRQLLEICQQLKNNDETLDTLRSIALLPVSGYQAEQRRVLKPLTNCLLHLTAHLNVVFGENLQCDHNEMSTRALQALNAEHNQNEQVSAAGFRWSHQLKHILVDEFQDTSVGQFKLLRALTSDWQQSNCCEPHQPKTLFIVGDGMQSIYSFRAAKVGLFLQAKQQGLGDLKLAALGLEQNFRSTAGIVNWVNKHFSSAFPAYADLSRGAVPYSPSVSFELSHQSVSLQTNGDKQNAVEVIACVDDDARECEALCIVKQIQQAQQQQPNIEIAILVRARSHLAKILPALDNENIIWQGVDIDSLHKREVIMDCLSLLRALLNPADEIAWYALLRAPWCGILLKDLQVVADVIAKNIVAANKTSKKYNSQQYGLAELLLFTLQDENHQQTCQLISGMTADGLLRLNVIAACLQTAWQVRGQNSTRHWLESTWQALGGNQLSKHSSEGDDSSSVKAFFDLLETLEQDATFTGQQLVFSDIEKKVKTLFSAPKAVQNQQANKPVQIMTIHKSKGLEFDMVILPGLDKSSSSSDKPLLISSERIFDDGSNGIAMYPLIKRSLLARDNKKTPTNLYGFLREEDKQAKSLESARLLYVAATRAKSKLVLLAGLKRSGDGNIKAPSSDSLFNKIWLTVEEELTLVEPVNIMSTEAVQTDGKVSYLKLKRLTQQSIHAIHTPSQLNAKCRSLDVDIDPVIDQLPVHTDADVNNDDLTPRAIGICSHEIFEQIALQGLEYWQAKNLAQLEPHWLLRLKALGASPNTAEQAVKQVSLVVSNVLSSDIGQWVFASSHSSAKNEWKLTLKTVGVSNGKDTQFTRLIIDRSFIDENNTRWIIDYKISERDSNESIGVFKSRQAKSYADQMQRYSSSVKTFDVQQQNEILETKSALYFPLLDCLIEM